MKKAISQLKDTIKQLAAEGRAIGVRIRQSKGLDRHQLWIEKRSLGDTARYVLLAYGCLRGMPYARIEQKVGKDNGPSPTAIANTLLRPLDEADRTAWTRERVQAWLKGEAPPVAAEAPATEVAA